MQKDNTGLPAEAAPPYKLFTAYAEIKLKGGGFGGGIFSSFYCVCRDQTLPIRRIGDASGRFLLRMQRSNEYRARHCFIRGSLFTAYAEIKLGRRWNPQEWRGFFLLRMQRSNEAGPKPPLGRVKLFTAYAEIKRSSFHGSGGVRGTFYCICRDQTVPCSISFGGRLRFLLRMQRSNPANPADRGRKWTLFTAYAEIKPRSSVF